MTWDQMFLDMAHLIAKKSKDPSTKCGAVLVDSNFVVLSTGFNGPPRQLIDEMIPWDKRPEKYSYVYHAEQNAIDYALEYGHVGKFPSASLYCTHLPCVECVLKIIRWNIGFIVVPAKRPLYQMSKYETVTPWDLIKSINLNRQLAPIYREVDYVCG